MNNKLNFGIHTTNVGRHQFLTFKLRWTVDEAIINLILQTESNLRQLCEVREVFSSVHIHKGKQILVLEGLCYEADSNYDEVKFLLTLLSYKIQQTKLDQKYIPILRKSTVEVEECEF